MLRPIAKYLIDLTLWVAVVPLAFWLRLDARVADYAQAMQWLTWLSLPLAGVLLWALGIGRQSWHRVSVRDLVQLVKGVGIWTVGMSGLAFFLARYMDIPRSIPLIAGMLALIIFSATRVSYRLYFEYKLLRGHKHTAKKVLVVGAGEAGTILVREMQRHPEAGRIAIGFLDDDPNKRRQKLLGLPVLGKLDELARVVPVYGVHEVLIALPSASGRIVRQVVQQARQVGVESRIFPGIYDMLSGRVSISQLREVDVEDLLKREPVRLEMNEIARYIEGKTVLITGAGGSIGSEIVRQVSRFNPRHLILLGRGENSLYSIERFIDGALPKLSYRTVVADVRDRAKLEHVFRQFRPQVVFHAAAHKHVPMMEGNADEAILNNVGGTRNLAELALEFEVERFVNISTDKAVNPTSVMGGSKRVAEYVVEWASRQCKPGQSFVSVRFGNVLGSRGSVIPLFKEQIRLGQPVTVTHADMTRYFMTIPEAAQLVLQAGGLGENGAVYVLDMGQPVKIMDLARDLIELSGLTPGVDVEIVVTGMRPGEKLYEELMTAEEGATATRHEKISVARKTGFSADDFETRLQELFEAARSRDVARIQANLLVLIPTYHREAPRLQPVAGGALSVVSGGSPSQS
jgi:FlaA1/EpsC-like NDP-sugar epimerase